MQDAVIKGIGNSRYLKTVGEALSLYPTYEDFLQAMIAGTFPVDFNGINKDGWTQQGTPLNKANLLSDTVISTLGLSTGANSTPNDAFNVLANIGNVHVWRKTVTTEEEVPAGYRLVDDTTNRNNVGDQTVSNALIFLIGDTTAELKYSTEITVNENGVVNLNSVISTNSVPSPVTVLNGKYIQLRYSFGKGPVNLDTNKIYYIPSDATVTLNSNNNGWILVNKLQYVDAYPAVPPSTHVTYLTSTNRNAYKPAGYKLGTKITGNIALTDRTNESSTIYWNYSDQVDVSDDWEVSLIAPNRVDFNATQSNAVNMAESLVGNFIMTTSSATAIKANTVYFIPDDASVAREMSGTKFVYTTAIQSVTGYPAIPAGTTIEYLGVLGDFGGSSLGYIKYGSYVGTGTENVIIPFKNRPLIGFLNVNVTMFTDTNWIVPTGSSGISNYTGSATWSGGKLTLSKGSYSQFPNSSGKTYKYVAFLEGE